MNLRHTWVLASVVMLFLSAGAPTLCAQDGVPVEKQELAELLAAAQQYQLRLVESNSSAMLREPSLLNFTNPERNQERGAVFVWLHKSRPIVVGQFFRFNARKGRLTKHAFHSLSATPLVASYQDAVRWAPNEPGVKWQTVPDAPEPAATHAGRLLQMRQLARRYRLTLTDAKENKTDLRLIARPLFDYEAPAEGVLSGALVSFAIATDPEALLLLEAYSEAGKATYRCGFARFHFQQIVAWDGEQEIWRVDYDPALMVNQPGSPATVRKVYNSFYHDNP